MVITATQTAADKFREIISQEKRDGFNIRLGVAGAGCSGFQYFLGLDDRSHDGDKSIEFDGFKILIDERSAPLMEGSTLDFQEDPTNPGFVFDNPNAPKPPPGCGGGTCSC